ncbi:hypothetical protein ACIBCA_29000 [Kitasatospora sp. NPDC051170]|uniref:hypothetical protein n=1 Tax=Kitasatospora sp. NPDC051170 TaxID=3364056 RepID=UPI00378CE4B9
MSFEVFCDIETLDLARSGSIWGDVWINIDGFDFPESNWNDMPLAFLVELLDAIADVRRREGDRRVRFFDGPFWVDLSGQGDGTVSISTNAPGGDKQVTVSARDISRSLEAIRVNVVRACLGRGWGEHLDVRRLQAQ